MGLFHKNENEMNFAGGSKNIMESIQREHDTNTLIYLDPREDFNTNSVITVAPNEQAIFIKNGELFGVLPSGRHEVKTENYPVLSRIRNMLTGGMSTFTCQVYHVSTSEQNVSWGTSSAIEIQDFFLGNGEIGVPTLIRGAGEFRVRFNVREDDNASVQTFLRLMGDKSRFTAKDLSVLFQAQLSQEVSSLVGKHLEQVSMSRSINAISSQIKDFATELQPTFSSLFKSYGLELVNFSFYNLSIDDTEERRKFVDRRIAAANVSDGRYNQAVQQEILKDISTNQGSGGIAGAGAGLGMGMAAGGAFGAMAMGAFAQPQQTGATFGAAATGGNAAPAQQPAPQAQSDPMEVLGKLKKMLDAGLIPQEKYDAKVDEILKNL